MNKIITILAIATLFSCSDDDVTTNVAPTTQGEPTENITYTQTNDTIAVSSKHWLELNQNQMYSIFATGQGKTLEVVSNNSNSAFFTSDNRYRVYSIVNQKRIVKTRLKYVNGILAETTQIGNEYVMTCTAFNNTHVLKFDTITQKYTDANGNIWSVN